MGSTQPTSTSLCWFQLYCQGLSIREKWHINMASIGKVEWNGKVERQNAEVFQLSESLSDSWMPGCCSSSHDTVFSAGVVFCLGALFPGA